MARVQHGILQRAWLRVLVLDSGSLFASIWLGIPWSGREGNEAATKCSFANWVLLHYQREVNHLLDDSMYKWQDL